MVHETRTVMMPLWSFRHLNSINLLKVKDKYFVGTRHAKVGSLSLQSVIAIPKATVRKQFVVADLNSGD